MKKPQRIKVALSEAELALLRDALFELVDSFGEEPDPLYDRLQRASDKLKAAGS